MYGRIECKTHHKISNIIYNYEFKIIKSTFQQTSRIYCNVSNISIFIIKLCYFFPFLILLIVSIDVSVLPLNKLNVYLLNQLCSADFYFVYENLKYSDKFIYTKSLFGILCKSTLYTIILIDISTHDRNNF